MTRERYQRVVEIFQAASERSADARPVFLAETCAGDDELRRDVEAMLAADAQSGGFLDKPADDLAAAAVAAREACSIIGQRFSHYEVVSLLGAGAMGEVYRAKDTRLRREVAIKFANTSFSDRFEREARAVAALNHPNICTLHDAGPSYLVMELVEGPTLADRIKRGVLSLEEALSIARQIADALEAAHEKGIVHRDLKPGNIKIKPDGTVKVLDFGLAKMSPDATPGATSGSSPTLTTHQGIVLGTAAYMSPEQARGNTVDKRTDIWAFGVVLYEMLTGQRPFCGETTTDVLAAIVTREPEWDRVPAKAQRVLRRCLEKEHKLRLRDIGDAMPLLDDAPAIKPARRTITQWAVAGLLMLAFAFANLRHSAEESRVLRYSVLPPEKATFKADSNPAVSPDGRRLAFVATISGKDILWIRDLNSLAARPLPGTDGAHEPFWSPDGRFLAFFAGGKLKKIDVSGGQALSICDFEDDDPIGGSWSKNGVIVFGPDVSGSLFRVSAVGGIATSVNIPDSAREFHKWPWFLPDGRHFLYSTEAADKKNNKVYVADLDSKAQRQVLEANSNVVYAPPGYLLFLRDRSLMAQPFDAGKLETTADPVAIAEQAGEFSLSQNGVLAYTSSVEFSRQLTWFDRSGKVTGTVGSPGHLIWPRISPDGKVVVVGQRDEETGYFDLWLHDLARGTASRFTFNFEARGPVPKASMLSGNSNPVWSPDGQRIAYGSSRDGLADLNIYQKEPSGAAQDELLDRSGGNKFPMDWSRDGRYIIEGAFDSKTLNDVWVLPLFGDKKPFPYLQTAFDERWAKLSPNGKWLAYASDETKRYEIYIQTFPTPGGKWQVSTNGGRLPVWSRDGGELFFVDPEGELMAVDIKRGDKFAAGVPKRLFDTHFKGRYGQFDVSKEGRFLIPAVVEQPDNVPMTVVVNWTSGLNK
jgi:serine/threonine protein kinase